MSTEITDLLQRGAGPAPAPVDVEGLRRCADRRRRNRQRANVVALVVVAAMVSAPLLWLVDREPAVVLDRPAGNEVLGVFEGVPERLDDRWGVLLPTSAVWQATQAGSYTIYVSPWGDGTFCTWAVTDTTAGGGCAGLFGTGSASSAHEGVSYALVPDGYDTYTADDGRTFPVTNNVIAISFDAQPDATDPSSERMPPGVLSGPAGERRLDSNDVPELQSDSRVGVVDGSWVSSAAPAGLVRQPAGDRAEPITPAGGPLATVDTVVGTIEVLPGASEVGGFDLGDPLCVAKVDPPVGPGVVSCGFMRVAGGLQPYVAAVTWPDADGGTDFAALVPDGWTELIYADGQAVPISDNVLVVDDIDQWPVTAMLRHADGTERIVAVAAYPPDGGSLPAEEATEGITAPPTPAPTPADDIRGAPLNGSAFGTAQFDSGPLNETAGAARLWFGPDAANQSVDRPVEFTSGARGSLTLAADATSRTDPTPAVTVGPGTESTGPDLSSVIWLIVVVLAVVGGAVWMGVRIGQAETMIIEEQGRQHREDGRPISPQGTHRWFF